MSNEKQVQPRKANTGAPAQRDFLGKDVDPQGGTEDEEERNGRLANSGSRAADDEAGAEQRSGRRGPARQDEGGAD